MDFAGVQEQSDCQAPSEEFSDPKQISSPFAIDWDCLGRLFANVGRSGFGAAYRDLAQDILGTSECTAFAFYGPSSPRAVVVESKDAARTSLMRSLGGSYVRDGHKSDPNIDLLFDVEEADVRIVRPSDLRDADYRRRYYDEPAISREIAVFGRWGRRYFHMGFYQLHYEAELAHDILSRTRALAKVLLPALHRHTELTFTPVESVDVDCPSEPKTASNEATLEHLAAVLTAEKKGLSPREAQVCASIVLGYRTLAISMILGVSENTISTHRKRAYAKLGISSQNELFARYFRTVGKFNINEQELARDDRDARHRPSPPEVKLADFQQRPH